MKLVSFMRRAICAVFVPLLSLPVADARAEWLIASHQTSVTQGGTAEVQIIGTGIHVGQIAPSPMNGHLETPHRTTPITLARSMAVTTGPAQTFTYTVPQDMLGLATLSVKDASRLLVEIKPPAQAGAVSHTGLAEASSAPSSARNASSVISAHEPVYVLMGPRDGINARFQLSFKYRLFETKGKFDNWLPGLSGFHVAYTQNSIWDLADDSEPFRDSSYRPSFFYQWEANQPGSSVLKTIQTGIEHESNGKDGDDSRSFFTFFVQPLWRFDFRENEDMNSRNGFHFAAGPKFQIYHWTDDNPDIHRYRGYTDLHLRAGYDTGWLLTSILRRGSTGKGSAQFDMSFPVKQTSDPNTGGFFHVQYFSGYGESFLEYNVRRKSQIRAGFSVVR
jgi:phospholipase A1/A2